MVKQEKQLYEFGSFRLDVRERLLLRDGQPLHLAPKAFDLLLTLVRKSGQTVEKDELMKEVWPDSFVEEANLTVHISALRRALGGRREGNGNGYIETVPKRGYRFNANVRMVREESPAAEQAAPHVTAAGETSEPEGRTQTGVEVATGFLPADGLTFVETARRETAQAQGVAATPRTTEPGPLAGWIGEHRIVASITLAALAVAVVGFALWMKRAVTGIQAPLPSIKITRLANTEKSVQVALSPDGKYIAHIISSAGQQSLWVSQVATNSSVQIVPPTDVAYGGLTFSKDGDYIFYVSNSALYQIPVLGGEARKVLADVAGAISFAPDGGWFAFVRSLNTEETALMIANVSGGGERILATRKKPEFLSSAGPAWSPDGSLIACPWGMIAGHKEMGITGVEVATAREKQITAQKWQAVDRVAWLSDGSGLIAPAVETGTGPLQIWHIPYPAGEARRITSDLNNYGDLSLTADSESLVTIQFERRSGLWIVPGGDPSRAKPVTSGKHDLYRVISLTPDGRILYPSNASGSRDIWIMNADGTKQKQLTANAGANLQPSASPDGRYIVFLSNRAKVGAFNIWRMDADGSNPIQLTHGSGEVQPSCSPDGRWVVYSQGGPETSPEKKTVWKVPIDGGEPVALTNTPASGPDISPDGRLIAIWYKQDATSPWKIALIPLAGGPPVKIFDATRTSIFRLRWTPDGQAVTYIDTRDEVSNIWSQPIGGGPPKQLTQFTSEQIEGFDWSSDGHLICSRGYNARDVVLISGFR